MQTKCLSQNIVLLLMAFLSLGFGVMGVVLAQPVEYGSPSSFIEMHGMVVQEYFDFQKDGANTGIGSFDNRYAYLFFDCPVRKNLKGVLETKYEHNGESLKVDRCYIDWKLHKLANFRTGKFYLPLYDIKNIRPTGNPLVSTDISYLIDPEIFRDIGIAGYGETDLTLNFNSTTKKIKLGYELALTNGGLLQEIIMDENKNVSVGEKFTDNNNDKAITARFYCFPIESLEISDTQYNTKTHIFYETTTLGKDNKLTTIKTDYGVFDMAINLIRANYSRDRLNVNGYYMTSKIESATTDSKSTTWWLMPAYKILKQKYVNYLELAARYKYSKSDSSTAGITKTATTSLGIGVSPYEHFILKMEYLMKDEIKGADKDDNGILFQASVDF